MQLKFKKLHPNAVIPKHAKPGDAGVDLVAVSKEYNGSGHIIYRTGLAVEIPNGYVGLIFPRSSIFKYDIALTNSVGVLDSGYRGEISFVFTGNGYAAAKLAYYLNEQLTQSDAEVVDYDVGDRIGQLVVMPYEVLNCEEVTELSETERGTGGFGSTGH